jgi:hypothetical protein
VSVLDSKYKLPTGDAKPKPAAPTITVVDQTAPKVLDKKFAMPTQSNAVAQPALEPDPIVAPKVLDKKFAMPTQSNAVVQPTLEPEPIVAPRVLDKKFAMPTWEAQPRSQVAPHVDEPALLSSMAVKPLDRKFRMPEAAEPCAKRVCIDTGDDTLAEARRRAADLRNKPQEPSASSPSPSLDELRLVAGELRKTKRKVNRTLDGFLGDAQGDAQGVAKRPAGPVGPSALEQVLAKVALAKRQKTKETKSSRVVKVKPSQPNELVGSTCLVSAPSTAPLRINAPTLGPEPIGLGSFLDRNAPQSSADILHNAEALSQCRRWLQEYQRRNPKIQRALLLHGPSGCGKAQSIRLLLREFGYAVEEFGADGKREPGDIEGSIKCSARNVIHAEAYEGDARPSAVILTDVDSLSQSKQKSAIAALKALICPWRFQPNYQGKQRWLAPIICIAQQRNAPAMHALHSACNCVEFQAPSQDELCSIANQVLATEQCKLGPEEVQRVAQASRGDVRRLQLFLELLLREKRAGLPSGSLAGGDLFEDAQSGTLRCIGEALQGKLLSFEACASLHTSAVSLVPQLLQENLPNAFEDLDGFARAFDALSLADVCEEQGLTRIAVEMREVQTMHAVYAPLNELALSCAATHSTLPALTYPSQRSLETRQRNSWALVQQVRQRCVALDAESGIELMHFVARQVMRQFPQHPDAVVGWLRSINFDWPETDYCLSRYCDLNGDTATALGERRIKKRPLERSQLADLRRRLDLAVEREKATVLRV